MRRVLLAALLALGLSAAGAPAGAAPTIAPTVRGEFYSFAGEVAPGVFAITVICDAVASSGAVATSVRCALSTGESASQALPGAAAGTTITTVTADRPVTACAVGAAMFLNGEIVTSARYCREVVPEAHTNR